MIADNNTTEIIWARKVNSGIKKIKTARHSNNSTEDMDLLFIISRMSFIRNEFLNYITKVVI
ncbi:hypothetical protein GCM10007028_06000 [Algibacter mikhailovii]|uniref:Uncharacterized protein n=1 Tax=Algibacter mikhailovii TaxID=425498 RepID=A0A918QVD0_9FLAO|nr:hypothetical protein GCM10007028_06000 [Algibacter mikhailovii]